MTRRALGVVALMLLAVGCRGGRSGHPQASATEEGRFPHASHRAVSCVECHALDAVLSGVPAVPGGRDHAPCDRSGCHRERFLEPPGPFCTLCHESVDPSRPGSAVPAPYPPVVGARALASEFSHAAHLDYGAMEKRVGFHVSCSDCHAASAKGELEPPDHAVCGRCHAPEAAPEGTPAMSQCQRCHRPRSAPPLRQRQLIVGDLHFSHANHQNDRTGRLILCSDCHADSAASMRAGVHPPPKTLACVTCHDDSTRTPVQMRMRVCETCHSTVEKTVAQLPPRSHLPEPDRPVDHTIAFRRDHAGEARTQSTRCAQCHSGMSGSPRDTCDECHANMRPGDHVVTWREYEHGPASRANTDRCATCHAADFCTACHSRPPRSHFPIMEFTQSGHGTLAKFEFRACVTCHDVEQSCTGSRCHTVRPRP